MNKFIIASFALVAFGACLVQAGLTSGFEDRIRSEANNLEGTIKKDANLLENTIKSDASNLEDTIKKNANTLENTFKSDANNLEEAIKRNIPKIPNIPDLSSLRNEIQALESDVSSFMPSLPSNIMKRLNSLIFRIRSIIPDI